MKKEIILKTYSEEFKKSIVQKIESGEMSISRASREYEIHGSMTIPRWLARYGKIRRQVRVLHTSIDSSGNGITKTALFTS